MNLPNVVAHADGELFRIWSYEEQAWLCPDGTYTPHKKEAGRFTRADLSAHDEAETVKRTLATTLDLVRLSVHIPLSPPGGAVEPDTVRAAVKLVTTWATRACDQMQPYRAPGEGVERSDTLHEGEPMNPKPCGQCAPCQARAALK